MEASVMKITQWNKRKGKDKGIFVKVTEKEALRLIRSLSAQLHSAAGANIERDAEREEFTSQEGIYFTVSAHGRNVGRLRKAAEDAILSHRLDEHSATELALAIGGLDPDV